MRRLADKNVRAPAVAALPRCVFCGFWPRTLPISAYPGPFAAKKFPQNVLAEHQGF
jgi:hypothetical protein